MLAKIQAFLAALLAKLEALNIISLVIGGAIGYFGHPLIKLAVDAAAGLLSLIFKL